MSKRFVILLIALTASFCTFAQILSDSTVQTVAYWHKNDRQTYNIVTKEYKLTAEGDTTDRQLLTYTVDITVKDSTADGYIIDWHYGNPDYKMPDADPQMASLMKDVLSLSDNITISIKTDGFGSFQEVLNWEDIRDYLRKTGDKLKKKYKKDKLLTEVFDRTIEQHSTREAIEGRAIEEIHQFYNFHGLQYTLADTLELQMELPNIFGEQPFPADTKVWLKEIDDANESYILVQQQSVPEEILRKATLDYLLQLGASMKAPAEEMPTLDDIPPVQNMQSVVSSIHESGWVFYSALRKANSIAGQVSVEETSIEMKQ